MEERILLIDDDVNFRSEFKECFPEYGITEANDGKQALAILRKPHVIDLVILDYRLPGASGIDVLKEIKSIDQTISVILFTAYGQKDLVIEALREKVDDFLEKPIDIVKTKLVIEKVLDTKKIGDDLDAGGIYSQIEKVKYFINRNVYKKVNLQDAAETVYVSPKYLSRIFKQIVGTGFKDYILKIKIAKVKELLVKTQYSVEQIAFKLGYENPESLIRIFHKFTGCTPSVYRTKRVKKYPGKKRF